MQVFVAHRGIALAEPKPPPKLKKKKRTPSNQPPRTTTATTLPGLSQQQRLQGGHDAHGAATAQQI
jgi:hypothetical protein